MSATATKNKSAASTSLTVPGLVAQANLDEDDLIQLTKLSESTVKKILGKRTDGCKTNRGTARVFVNAFNTVGEFQDVREMLENHYGITELTIDDLPWPGGLSDNGKEPFCEVAPDHHLVSTFDIGEDETTCPNCFVYVKKVESTCRNCLEVLPKLPQPEKALAEAD